MTNLDLLSNVLAHATGKPADFWRKHAIRCFRHDPAAMRQLRRQCPDYHRKLAALKAEGGGVLNWLVAGTLLERIIK